MTPPDQPKLSVQAAELIVRFLRLRWWGTVEDLVAGVTQDITFDDLDLDLDLDELLRAVSRTQLEEFVRQVLLCEQPLSAEHALIQPVEAPLPEARAFLVLMAVNLAILGLGETGRGLILGHLKSASEPRFRSLSALGEMLARTLPLSRARRWIEEHLSEPDQALALASCGADVHQPTEPLIHVPTDAAALAGAVTQILERQGLIRCPWGSTKATIRLAGARRGGRFATLIGSIDNLKILEKLACGLSEEKHHGTAILVNLEAPGRVQEYRRGKLRNEDLGSEEKDAVELIGGLLERGVRVYDRRAPRSIEHLSYRAFAPAIKARMKAEGGPRALAFAPGTRRRRKRKAPK